MLAFVSAYVVAIFAMLFSAASALTLIRAVKHLDPPEVRVTQEEAQKKVA